MTTWAQRKRHEFIRERIDAGHMLNRSDLVEEFTITKQTASATLHQFEALYPGVIAYDGRVKAFVRADLAESGSCRPSQRWIRRVRSLLESIRDAEDANDIVADGGVTVAMVWAQDAADLLADGALGRRDGSPKATAMNQEDPSA